ncbi:hypothetical protein PSI23_11110 [Xenorhabdus sp. XENO-10]|uniref:Uncharacterized protein n=1 Tax=Xenorhabdus yunnanensis TaxID=3025878 RepID=A0ABT5LFF4_9GAMM|nr:hypothetical protein [Xenorhabdus yunnanensis]MDC9589832.1 hypothetical protein [Xenorhabdus yunnanensis]
MAEKITQRTRRQKVSESPKMLAYETPQTRQQKANEGLDIVSHKIPEDTLTESKAPRKRVHFQRGGTALQIRHNPNQLLQVRGNDKNVTALRDRMKPPVSPGATPLAIIDAYGHIMPFDAESPIDRVILANVPDITYIYTHDDLQEALRINQEKIQQRRFHETVQGARLFVEPVLPTHGFRNGNEVVSAFYDETRMGNDAVVIQDLNDMSKDVF